MRIALDLIGISDRIQKVREFIATVGPKNATVLIEGETGTGKELVAQAIHQSSGRTGLFVAVNCAAIPEGLLESELFGHEKGSFTGAFVQKKGKFEVADRGTLFLDEIGILPLPSQAKLLRVLQQREVERVGGTRPIPVDFRLVAATNRDLQHDVGEGLFREDLFFRLNISYIELPALRDRREDIPVLARHFITKYVAIYGGPVLGISSEAESLLMEFEWPGNVRQLENVIENAIVMARNEWITKADVAGRLTARQRQGAGLNYHQRLQAFKRRLVQDAIRSVAGNWRQAALVLGLHPNSFHRLVRALDLTHLLKSSSTDR